MSARTLEPRFTVRMLVQAVAGAPVSLWLYERALVFCCLARCVGCDVCGDRFTGIELIGDIPMNVFTFHRAGTCRHPWRTEWEPVEGATFEHVVAAVVLILTEGA
jgi:hypothetical protein